MKEFINTYTKGEVKEDRVFVISRMAQEAKEKFGDDNVVNSVIGTLYDEDMKLVAFDSVFKAYEQVDNRQKAKYASSIQGNLSYREAVYKWLFEMAGVDIDCEIIATPGGTGAISNTVKTTLEYNDTFIVPNIGWGPYQTIAEINALNLRSYNVFSGDHFDLDSFKEACDEVMNKQEKVVAIINDPAHNPTGYTMAPEEWDNLLAYINEASKKGPFILIHDIAYMDYNSQGTEWKKNFAKFKNLSENVLVVIAFSLSKTMTLYGMRAGAQVAISSNKDALRRFKNGSVHTARGTWSTVNNSAMTLFSNILADEKLVDAFLNEKLAYVKLLKERGEIFYNEAKEVGLDIYPYKEGFFLTLRMHDNLEREAVLEELFKENIFTVPFDKGLRIAVCSVPKRQLYGLAKRIKTVYDRVINK